jgi:Secretion system C-terminal sorting domain/Outer membrane protein Omp28
MKKKLLALLCLSALGLSLQAQTIVPTTPQNKKIILEEFTGVNCVFCPQGHTIANNLTNANPGNFFVINVHVGGFATPSAGQPDFRTPFGSALAGQSGLTGYPSGTINRRVFSSAMTAGGTALGRGGWTTATNQTKIQPSYVNVAATSTIDVVSRVLTVHVEGYYTGSSPVTTNKLNVALVQNNTPGPQTGGNLGSNYNHQHRLVHMLTGQWGTDITNTATGSFVDQTLTYTIPAAYNNIPAELGELEVVAFIAEGQQNIISGNETSPTFLGLANSDANLLSIAAIPSQCSTSYSPKIVIQNNGNAPLTSLLINYSINSGTTEQLNWTGNLSPLAKATITLPSTSYAPQAINSVTINIPADDVLTNNSKTINFENAVETTNTLNLSLQTDAYGGEITWNVKNSAGISVANGGPYGNNIPVNAVITLPNDDCYSFNLIDSYGDGGGATTLSDSNGTEIFYTNGVYGSGASQNLRSLASLKSDSFTQAKVRIYPNPSNGIFTISTTANAKLEVIDLTGKSVFKTDKISNSSEIDLSNLQKGIYLAKIKTENSSYTEKLIIN